MSDAVESAGGAGYGKYILLFVVMILGTFLDGLDGTIVNVVLPEIADTFSIDPTDASWVITTYFLIMAGLILIVGKICDRGAIKKVLLAGFIVFTMGSLLCGLSHSFAALLVFRAIQGVGAAFLAASCIMLNVKFLPSHMIAFGLSMGVLGYFLGAAMGPVLGGIIGEYSSWHWIFFINVPIGIIAFFLTAKVIPTDTKMDSEPFDLKGSAVLFLMLAFGLYALESSPKSGLTGMTLISAVLFVVFFALFIIIERRCEYPVLKLSIFKSRRFDLVMFAYLLLNACYMGALYLLPFFLDIGMELETVVRGLYLLLPAVVTLAICLWVGKACVRIGNRPFVLAACISMISFAVMFSFLDGDSPLPLIITALVLLGLVWGLCGGPAGDRLIESVPDGDKSSGSAILSFLIYFGSALGTAMFSGLFNIGSPMPGVPITELPQFAFLEGMHFAMMVCAALSVVALVATWVVRDRREQDEPA